jgi:lipoprotein-anchoring transpeptidase ErfK/SrfK
MAIVKNESIARIVMLFCFGTAILSLIIHWRIRTATEQLNQSASTGLRVHSHRHFSQEKVDDDKSPVEIGETALGASLPISPDEFSGLKRQIHLTKKNQIRRKIQLVMPTARESLVTDNLPVPSPESASDQTQVVVNLGDRRVYVYHYDEVIASYPIAVGKKGWETPTGDFHIMHMEQHPIWRHPITGKVFEPGSNSPLGDRWIGFWSDGRNEVGFHGTPNIDLVGTAISHGCLRMRNSDVRLLYSQVGLGTPVTVRN